MRGQRPQHGSPLSSLNTMASCPLLLPCRERFGVKPLEGSTQVAQEDTEAHVCSQARPRPVPPTSFLPVPSPGAAEP